MLKELTPVTDVDGVAADEIIQQVERVLCNPTVSSSKRSVAFLRYVVAETLRGTDSIKERTIGVELYGRSPAYDTNLDHVVRTAAVELRKRLAIYYGDPQHAGELRITILPGSYVPRFHWPAESSGSHSAPASGHHGSADLFPAVDAASELRRHENEAHGELPPAIVSSGTGVAVRHSLSRATTWGLVCASTLFCVLGAFGWTQYRRAHSPERLFWGPLLDSPSPVLIAVGTARDGLPRESGEVDGAPLVIPSPAAPRYIPYADALATAIVAGRLSAMGQKVEIRRSVETTFSDLKGAPAVLVGSFDNPWSLRLMRGLRFSAEVDNEAHTVYIRDAHNPTSRTWQFKNPASSGVAGAYGSPLVHDYAIVSRVREPQTNRIIIQIGGLEPYGTQVAGEFVTDADQLAQLARSVRLDDRRNLQIVLETTVTDGTPGAPRIIAVAVE